MFEKFIAKIISMVLGIRFRLLGKNPTINISKQLARVNRIIIYMPNKLEHFKIALNSIITLRKKLPRSKITLVSKIEWVTLIEDCIKVEVLPYSAKDINFFGLPKKTIQQYFNTSSFDLALDLNLGFNVLSIAIFQMSKAPLKVCLDSRGKSQFYNISIRINNSESLDKKYSAIIKYITNSKGPEEILKKTAQEIN